MWAGLKDVVPLPRHQSERAGSAMKLRVVPIGLGHAPAQESEQAELEAIISRCPFGDPVGEPLRAGFLGPKPAALTERIHLRGPRLVSKFGGAESRWRLLDH